MNLESKEEIGLRKKIVEVSKRLYDKGLVSGAGGNVSARILGSNQALVTPSGLCKGHLEVTDIVKVDLEGKILRGSLKPTSETPMHTEIYKVRSDINAIVHAHPAISTGFACTEVSLDISIFPDAIAMIGDVATVRYITPTTTELALEVAERAKDRNRSIDRSIVNALLLRNHGTITLGASLEQAYQRTEILEDLAKISLVSTLLGGSKRLSKKEVKMIRGLKAEKHRLKFVEEQK